MVQQGIEFVCVSKHYLAGDLDKPALQDITLTLHPGEYVGLMGMNGSGKSTLARLCNGLLKPTSGQVYVNGLDTGEAEKQAEIRRQVGLVFQNPDNQMICPVVEEEIAFGLENLDLPLAEIQQRIDWALGAVGLEEKRYHAPHLLSGGQKQKIALAAVLAMRPHYLILDEPFSMLDPVSRQELLQLLKDLHTRSKMTLLLLSHNPEDFIHADRILVMDQGAVCLQGTPRQVFSRERELAALGLESPGVYRLINRLTQKGRLISNPIRTIPDLVEELCKK